MLAHYETLDCGGVLTALASFAVVFAVLYQVRKTIEWNDDRKVKAGFDVVRNDALKVDAWVATFDGDQEQVVVIRNYSSGALRDVKLKVRWSIGDGAEESIPSIASCLQVLPRGTWIARRESKASGKQWGFPKRISKDEELAFTSLFAGNIAQKANRIHWAACRSRMATAGCPKL